MIEIIAMLAIIAMFAVLLLRALLREIDVRYVRQEHAALRSYSDALQRGMMRRGCIPDQTTWGGLVAGETGTEPGAITQNSRHQPRLLLIDTGDLFDPSVWTLPYTQYVGGIFRANPPINPAKRARFMLASSVGPTPLPVSAGLMVATNFETLWNLPPGATPPTPTWAGFPAADLILERIDLSPRILILTLTTDSNTESKKGRYRVGSDSTFQTADDEPHFYLENTVLSLYHSQDNGGALDSQHVLIRNASFYYDGHKWVSGESGGPKYGGLDLAAVAAQFLTCVRNLNAPPNQQLTLLQAMINYMKGYVAWREVGGSSAGPMYNALVQTQQVMMVEAQNIFKKNIGRYPVNGVGCP